MQRRCVISESYHDDDSTALPLNGALIVSSFSVPSALIHLEIRPAEAAPPWPVLVPVCSSVAVPLLS